MDFFYLFLVLYVIFSVLFAVIFVFFRQQINAKLYFLLPFILALLVFFPAFLFCLGYWCCLKDLQRTKKKKQKANQFEYITRKYTPNYSRGKVGK